MRWFVFLTAVFLLSFNAIPAEKTKLVVAIIDTGLDVQDPRFTTFICRPELDQDFTGEGLSDQNRHGTHVAGLIIRKNDPKKFCLVIVKVFDKNGKYHNDSYERGIHYLRDLHPDIVNMSLSGAYFNEQESLLVRENPKTLFVVAAGNDGLDLSKTDSFPASLSKVSSNVIPVGALGTNHRRLKSSNYGLPRMKWFPGENVYSTFPGGTYGYLSGTSMATGNATNAVIRGYDRATDSFSILPSMEKDSQ